MADTLNEALSDIGTIVDNIRATSPLYSIQDGGGVVIGLDLQSDASQMSVPPGVTVNNFGTVVFNSGSTLTIDTGGTINFNAGSIVNFYAATYTFQSNVTFLYATAATTVTFAGFVIVQDLVACSDWWYCYTALTWNTDKTDYDQSINKVLWLLNVTGAVNLTGIIPRTTVVGYSQQLTLVNITTSTNSITVKNDATSSAANRIYTPGGVDYVVPPGMTLILQYDPTADTSVGRWRVVAPMGNVSSGGTGVTSLTAYAPIFGGTGSTSGVQQTALGTAGWVLTSNGGGAVATFQAPGAASLTTYSANNTSYSITGSYADVTGLSVTVAAGTYQIVVDGGYQWNPSAGAQTMTVRLFDGTSAIGNTDPTIIDSVDMTPLGGTQYGTFSVRSTYTAAGAITITLQAKVSAAGLTPAIINSNMFVIKTG